MALKTVDHLLTTSRSVRKQLAYSRPVEREVIERCIELALQAPTSSNRQTWRFVSIQTGKVFETLSVCWGNHN